MPSEKASSSLCSTILTINFFCAFEEKHLSNSSWTEVSKVNVKFRATWLNQWKINNGDECS